MPPKMPAMTILSLCALVALLPVTSAGQAKGLISKSTANYRVRYDKNVSSDDIRKLGKQLENAYTEYSGRLGTSFHRKVDVYGFSSASRFRSDSHSGVYDDGDLRDGRLYFNVSTVMKCDTAVRDPVSRVVSEAILGEIKWCPRWLTEIYGIYAGKDISRFGPPAALNSSTFSDLMEDYARAESPKDQVEVHARLAATARFLIERYGEKKVEQLYLQFRRPLTVEDAFEAAFGEKFPVIEKAWAAALRSPPKG
jgi:hypothetical protein